jgi:5-methylcytosine-specific restriction enzyme subunit McrC
VPAILRPADTAVYCTALGLPRGHLVYAKGNEPAVMHVVRNVGVEIVQHALDLDQPPTDLLTDISDIAKSIADTRSGTFLPM